MTNQTIRLVLATSLLCGSAVPVLAQAEGGPVIEEIIVTAQKRAETLQNTPISIVAITAAGIERQGIRDITDLQTVVPGLQVTPHPNSATTARVFIRGVGNNDDQITQDPSVAVYLDGVYIARSQGLSAEVADIERIEVLRGPQGALYGRNATGGAINYITRAPDLDSFGFKQSLAYGNQDQFRSRTRVNIPVADILAVELGYLRSQKNGFVSNPGTGVSRWGDQRRNAYRAAVRLKPSDTLDIRYTYDRSDIDDTPVFMALAPFYPAMADRPRAGSPFVRNLLRNDVTAQGHNLTANWEATESLTFRSITGYRKLDGVTHQNYLTGAAGPFALYETDFDQNQKQFTQELQAIGDLLDGQIEYVLGAYYFDESATSFDIARAFRRPIVERTVTINNSAHALYGQVTFRPEFATGLYVTPSLRWSGDKRQATLQTATIPASGAPVITPSGHGDRSFSNVSPGVTIGYTVNGDDSSANIYAKFASGYKTGGYNVRASTITRFEEGFNQENLDSWEAGVKSTLFRNRLHVNLAGFVSKYRNIQVNVQSDPGNISVTDVLNAGKATIKGVEADVRAVPFKGLTLGLNYAYLDAGYDKILNAAGVDVTSSFNFVEAPRNTVSLNAQYEFPATPIGVLTAYVDYFHQSRKFSSSTDKRYITGAYGLLDARLSLEEIPLGFGSWRLAAFARNLTDRKYYIGHFNAGMPAAIFGEPRSYGLELAFEY